MELTPLNEKHIPLWREAVDSGAFSPSPLGGPEYSSTMRKSWGKTFIFRHENLFIPLWKVGTRFSGFLKAQFYEGARFNSLLGIETINDKVFQALESLRKAGFLKLHIPEEIYHPFKEKFHSLDYFPEDVYEYFKVALPASYEEWFNRPGICRKNILRAMDSEVSVGLGGIELLDYFYDLYLKSYSRWKKRCLAGRAHSKERFRRIFNLPGSRTKIALGCYDGKPISAAIFCNYKNTAAAFSAGTDYRFQHMRPSDLVQSEIIRFLIAMGVKEYNLGGNLGSKTLDRFKKKLGGGPYRSYLLGHHRFPKIQKLIKTSSLRTNVQT